MAISFSTPAKGSFESVVERVESALSDEGFGVLSRIDVQATLKAKLDLDMEPYLILGACNPPMASKAISMEPSIGVLLPCNVVVRGSDGGTIVEFMDPQAVLGLIDREEIAGVATEVRTRLQRVKEVIAAA